MNNKVAIIGSGIAGIATSIRLKAKGFDVTVYEKNSFPGGKLSSFKLGEFRFDAGPSLFTMPQYVDELFEISGENPKEHFKYKKKKIACKYFWEDESIFNAYSDKEKFYDECENKFNVENGHACMLWIVWLMIEVDVAPFGANIAAAELIR